MKLACSMVFATIASQLPWPARSAGDMQGPIQPIPAPPLELYYGYGTEPSPASWQESDGLRATMKYDTLGKNLEIYWSHSSGASRTLAVALGYYPTAAECFVAGTTLVGGRDTRGKTILEQMTIQQPATVVNTSTGDISLVGGSVVAIERLYDERTSGRDLIKFVLPKLEEESHVLLWFWDSRDIYDFNIRTGEYSLIASPTQVAGVLHVPELDAAYFEWGADQHVDHGFIYLLSALSRDVAPIVLKDEDMDGDLDSYVATTPATWQSLGFGDPGKYVH